MPSFSGALATGLTEDLTNRAYAGGLSGNLAGVPAWQSYALADGTTLDALAERETGTLGEGTIVGVPTSYTGILQANPGDDWFENIILLPRRYDFGIIVAIQDEDFELYSSYRNDVRTWASYTNNTDASVQVTNLPGLPKTMLTQTSEDLNLQVLLDGPTVIDGTLDFGIDTGTVYLPITGQRSVIFPFAPLVPFIEVLRFKTDLLKKRNGEEQRIVLRDTPRQLFRARYQLDGAPRRKFENIVFDFQGRAVGLPMWHEPSILSAPITIGDSTITVDSTAYADWRAGGVGIVVLDDETYEGLAVTSFTSTSVTFSSTFTKAFPVGAYVMPVRTAYMQQTISGSRSIINLRDWNLEFTVLDNDVDLSDVSAFAAYKSKVFLDEPNVVSGAMEETTERRIERVDSLVGTFSSSSPWSVSKKGGRKAWFSNTRQRLWEVRQLVHALKGRAISFFLPTFFDDLEVTAPVVSSSTGLTIANVGFTNLVQSRIPKGDLQLILTDGTKVIRGIVSSVEVSSTTETITVDGTWGVDATIDEVDRVEFVEKTRLDSDDVTFEHRGAIGDCLIHAPTRTVVE